MGESDCHSLVPLAHAGKLAGRRLLPHGFFGRLAAKSANRQKAASALRKEAIRHCGAGETLAAIAKSYGRFALNDVAVVAGPRQLCRWFLFKPQSRQKTGLWQQLPCHIAALNSRRDRVTTSQSLKLAARKIFERRVWVRLRWKEVGHKPPVERRANSQGPASRGDHEPG
jgi:hypothetical protein